MTETTNYFLWKELFNAISLSNNTCSLKTTQKIIQEIVDDINQEETPHLFFKCKLEQMLFLMNTLSYLDNNNKKPIQKGINGLCDMCQEYIKERISKI